MCYGGNWQGGMAGQGMGGPQKSMSFAVQDPSQPNAAVQPMQVQPQAQQYSAFGGNGMFTNPMAQYMPQQQFQMPQWMMQGMGAMFGAQKQGGASFQNAPFYPYGPPSGAPTPTPPPGPTPTPTPTPVQPAPVQPTSPVTGAPARPRPALASAGNYAERPANWQYGNRSFDPTGQTMVTPENAWYYGVDAIGRPIDPKTNQAYASNLPAADGFNRARPWIGG